MKELVIKTLELARLSRPDAAMTLDNVDLSRQVKIALEERETILEEKRMQVENRLDGEIMVKADSLRLREVLNNIISNAVKFTPENGTLTIDATRESEFVTVSIGDTGIGMTEEQLSHIFDEFYKADPSRHELASTGLGLSICKRIIEKHGGKIWASSPGLGKGSTLFFTLKLGDGRLKVITEEKANDKSSNGSR
jgi:signal transduction histidine kinase